MNTCRQSDGGRARYAGLESSIEFLGSSPVVQQLVEDAILAAREGDAPILITGPVGSGKSHLARFIHQNSKRSSGPLVFVDCGALPDLENVLFGHRQGAFTGAVAPLPGRLQQAHRGVLVLDDLERLEAHQQDMLHRVLVDGRFYAVGGESEQKVDIRFVATTNKKPLEEVAAGRIKADFLSRLDYFLLEVPPLKNRIEDIPDLCRALLERRVGELVDKGIRTDGNLEFDEDCWPLIKARSFDDNVRGLDKLVVRLISRVRQRQVIEPSDIENAYPVLRSSRQPWYEQPQTLRMVREAAERDYILQVCRHAKNNLRQVARILGVSPKALYSRLRQYGITRE